MKAYKNVAVVGKHDGVQLADPLNAVLLVLRKRGLKVVMDTKTAELSPVAPDRIVPLQAIGEGTDLLVAVGGDGTLLAVARLVAPHGVPIIGINLGRLGFLTDIPADAISGLLNSVLDGAYKIEQRMMLNAAIRRAGKTIYETVALNDVVVSRGAMGSMIEFSVEVNSEFVYSVRADGLIIATPTGSTAYALSAGGPILHPSLPAISLVPISPHTLSNRPVAIPSTSEVEVKLIRGQNARVNFDVQSYFDPQPDDMVVVKAHQEKVTLLHPEGYSYFGMLRSKLHWNELP
jgi:NAD+ kinase